MKSLRVQLSGSLTACLLLLGGWANAATVLTVGDNDEIATAILGLEVNGTTYNVDFVSFSPRIETPSPEFDGGPAADLAMDAVVEALNGAPDAITAVGSVGESENAADFLLAYESTGNLFYLEGACGSRITECSGEWSNVGVSGPTPRVSFEISARFSVVPIPAAAWLFGSALGLLGWLKRRAA